MSENGPGGGDVSRPQGISLPDVQRPDPGDRVGSGAGRVQTTGRLQCEPRERGLADFRANGVTIGWLSDPEVLVQVGDAEQLSTLVDAKRSVAHSFCGLVVKGQAPVRSRSSLGKRVIVTNPGPGLCSVVDIDYGGVYDYDLGIHMCAFVIQATKKKLLDGVERIVPDPGYFDLWEDGLSGCSDDDSEVQVFGARSRNELHPGRSSDDQLHLLRQMTFG